MKALENISIMFHNDPPPRPNDVEISPKTDEPPIYQGDGSEPPKEQVGTGNGG